MYSLQSDWLIGYDIASTRLRAKACRSLRKLCSGYQKSVFEVSQDRAQIQALAMWLSLELDPASDRLFVALLSRSWPIWRSGPGANPAHQGFLVFS